MGLIAQLKADGWAPVPIAPGEKRPSIVDWQSRSFDEDDFSPGDNVGNKNGSPSGRIDVDCDAVQAVALAAQLLPHTRIHGRPGKPASHYWYASDVPTTTFKDVNGEMLLEIRGTNSQTVLPPSTHPSGETLQWYDERPVLVLDPETLKSAVTVLAVATLLARHWPAGSRHEMSGHLGGFLARAGWDAPLIARVVRGAAHVAGDNEVEDRVRYARETAEKHANGARTTGGVKLREILSVDVVNLLSRWLRLEESNRIDELNERYFVVQIGRTMAVGQEPRSPDRPVKFLTFTDFEQKHCNQHVEKKRLGRWWLEHPQRRSYEELIFAPPGCRLHQGPNDYNLWRGFTVEPDPLPRPEHRIPRYLAHLHDVIASGSTLSYEYVLDLMADCVQRPGDPPGKALALRGGQGAGKGAAIEPFGRLFGQHFMALNHREQIVGKFNAHLAGKIVVFADEAVWGGHREDVGILKHIVTQREVPVQRKGLDTVSEPNFLHLFMATNEDWVWPAGKKERRGVILDVGTVRPQTYFDALWAEIHSPGFAPALLAVLLARRVDYSRLRGGLNTKALREQMALSADGVQQWWQMILEDGAINGEWPVFVPAADLYDRYTEDMGSARGAGMSHRGTRMQVMERLLKLLPPSATYSARRWKVNTMPKGFPPQIEVKSVRGISFPSVQACRRWFDQVTGVDHDWEGEPEQETLVETDDGEIES